MKKTKNLGLNLPEMGDVINIDDINENTEKMDTMSHPNLLLNPWFTVRQRGDGPWEGEGDYTVDGWYIPFNPNVVSITAMEDGLQISRSDEVWIAQKIPIEVANEITGKMIRVTTKASTGMYYSSDAKTFISKGDSNVTLVDEPGKIAIYLEWQVSQNEPLFVCILRDSAIRYRAIKLELGSVSTLANDIAPDYGTELAKCQRYYQVMDTVFWLAKSTDGAYRGTLIYPVQMRGNPKITFTSLAPGGTCRLDTITKTGATFSAPGDSGYAAIESAILDANL